MSVSFEIYTLYHGRWEMHSRFDQSEEPRARKEIEVLENDAHIDAVCMVRETYNSKTNESRDFVVYNSPWIKKTLAQGVADL